MQASSLSIFATVFLVLCLGYINDAAILQREPTYLIVAPTSIRPNQDVTVAATVLKMEFDSFTVTTLIRKLNGDTYEEIVGATYTFTRVGSHDITMRTREQMSPGNYTLRVAGYSDRGLQGQIFQNDTELFFNNKQISVFIQTSKPFYKQGQIVRFRVIPVQTNLMPVSTTMDVKIRDPNGYVVREYYAQHTNAGGVVSLNYPLTASHLPYGNWSIEVFCQYEYYNKSFSVEEFYPPLFYVNVSMPTYMLRNSFGLSGLIASNHTTGRGTKGNATITLEIKSAQAQDSLKIEPITRIIPYFDSRTDFLFTREEMEQRAGGPTSLLGKELRVTGYVQDWFYNTTSIGFQSAIVYDEDADLEFLGGNVWTFKPDMPFKISIAAIKQDGSPLDPFNENRTINLVIEETTTGQPNRRTDTVEVSRETSVAEYWLYPSSNTRRISVTARYRNKEDTRKELVATRFWSPNNYFLQLSTPTLYPKVGEYMIFNVKTNTFVDKIYYHIVSAGEILVSDTLLMYSRSKLFSVALSREMAPSSKIVAYFVANDGQVVADSLNFYVNGSLLHEMTVKFNRGKDLAYDTVEITATADPLSYVAFSAIEYQLYELGARNDLTWEMVYHEMYSYEGLSNTSVHHHWMKEGMTEYSHYVPTPSFAHDANTTFFYAGLYVFTDANASAVFTHCNKSKGELPCMDGLSCYDYRQSCSWKPECSFDHKDEMGCVNLTKSYQVTLYDDDRLWRTKHIGLYYQDGAFMWQDQFTKPNGRIDIRVNIPTFPTTWVVSAFAMSREHGLSILPVPARFDGVRPMFITVQGPPTAKIGEHISLRVSVFNYWDESLDVLLTIEQSPDYNFVGLNSDTLSTDPAEPVTGAQQILVPVFPGDNRQINIPVVPRKFGHLAIPVNAFCFVSGHTVKHHVYVQHYGVREHYITNYQVDLTIANSETLPDMFIPVEEEPITPEQRIQNYVPGSPMTKVYVIGDIIGVSFFPYAHYNLDTRNLLDQPFGTGAETVFNLAVNLYTLKTLRRLSSDNFNTEKIDKVVDTLNYYLQELMFYMLNDGSYKEFRWSRKSSTWLTATALIILSQSREGTSDLYLDFQVPPETISKAAFWLSKQQNPDTGAFMETSYLYNRRYESSYNVNVDGVERPSNVSLTALCVLALSEANDLSEAAAKSVSEAKIKGVEFLERQVSIVNDPFETAILTYALKLTSKNGAANNEVLNKLKSLKRLEGKMAYWSSHAIPPITKGPSGLDNVVSLLSKQYSNVTSYAVSATGYALLAYLQNTEPEDEIRPIQKFLQEQHMWVGGFSSTQDTLVAMQALKLLAERNQDRVTYSMTFQFKSDQDPSWSKALTIDQDNWFDLQVVELPTHWGRIQTEVNGHGVALVQMETYKNHEQVYQLRKPLKNVFKFADDFNKQIHTSGFNHSYIHYYLCPSWTGDGDRSGMAVLEVGIPSGYVVHNNTLKALVQNARDNTASTLRNAEFVGEKALFYFDYLDRSEDVNCAKFSAFRWFPVANISEHTFVRVYEYYEPGNFNHTFYEKIELRALTICLVCGSYQCPFCPHYASGSFSSPNILLIAVATIVALFSYVDIFSFNISRQLQGPFKSKL